MTYTSWFQVEKNAARVKGSFEHAQGCRQVTAAARERKSAAEHLTFHQTFFGSALKFGKAGKEKRPLIFTIGKTESGR